MDHKDRLTLPLFHIQYLTYYSSTLCARSRLHSRKVTLGKYLLFRSDPQYCVIRAWAVIPTSLGNYWAIESDMNHYKGIRIDEDPHNQHNECFTPVMPPVPLDKHPIPAWRWDSATS